MNVAKAAAVYDFVSTANALKAEILTLPEGNSTELGKTIMQRSHRSAMTKLLYRHVNLSSACHWLQAAYLIADTQ